MPKTCARCFTLMLLFAVVAVAENTDRLSVEDSLLLVAKQVPYSNAEWISRAQRANPDARATLYRVIDRPAANESRIQAGLLSRYIGDASDVPLLLDRMKATVVPASSEDTQYLLRMMYVFGDMYKRGITEAGQSLDAMVSPKFWKERRTRLTYRDQPGGLSSESDCALEALRAWVKAAPDQIAAKARILSDAVVVWSVRNAALVTLLVLAISAGLQLLLGPVGVPVFPGRCKLPVSEWLERILC